MDDITFCLSECKRTDCYRHPSNIQDRTIPHSYAYFRETDTCPEKMQLSKEDATKDAIFDCISRQAVINEMKDMYTAAEEWAQGAHDDDTKARAESCMATNVELKLRIEKLPSVQPQRWIPVTEKLPEHSGFYIVTAIVTDDGGKLVGLRWFSQEHGWKFGKNPLAWMPLPECYKGEQDET